MIRRFAFIAACLIASIASAQGTEGLNIPLGLGKMKLPRDNPITAEKIELGKQLFFDARLSRDSTVSCATCHEPAKGWSNGERFATGVRGQKGGRSAPTIVNAAFQHFQFWDGRAAQLEGQALGPIQNPIEMDMTLDELVERLNGIEGYRTQFQSIYGSDATPDAVAKSIAAFERTVLSGNAPYDRFRAGDQAALSEPAQRGMEVFFNRGHCSACHAGANFTDGSFHNIGIGADDEAPDSGREVHSTLEGDRSAFKTPTLREIARTAPYMHDGRLATLEEVVDYYTRGGTPNEHLDEEIFSIKLTPEDKADLVAFLKEALSSEEYPIVEAPQLPE